ncbi:Superkiller protein 3 [Rhodotorula sphaerocarpa]
MSIFVKPKLKALKECLAAKDWEGVQKNANAVLDYESANYNARVFLALALFNLGKADESEETYKKAIELAPSQALGRQGLASFYEKQSRWIDYARELQGLMQLFAESQDAPKYAETLEKLLDLIETLSLLVPSSPVFPLLSSLPRYDATAPTATNYSGVQQAVGSPLNVLLELTSLISAIESAAVEAEIKKRRQRLGGPAMTAEATTKQVQAELLPFSRLPGLWRQILDDADAGSDEGLRRDTERRLLVHLRTTLAALPSSFDPPSVDLSGGKQKKSEADASADQEKKDRYRVEVEALARDMCVIGVSEGMAWEVEVEWSDVYADADPADWPADHWNALEVFASHFPESGLARIVLAYRQMLLAQAALAAPAPSEEDDADRPPAPQGPSSEEMADIVERGLAESPRSLVVHLLASAFFRTQREWDAVMQTTEAGVSIVKDIEAEAGKALSRSRRALDTDLALALTYCDAPAHHLRALRLLETLLAKAPPPPAHPASTPRPHPDPTLLIAKATVLQAADGKQAAALKVWEQILALPSEALPAAQRVYADAERAWALHLSGDSQGAAKTLDAAVQSYEERKVSRDKAREELEKYRSRKGIEKPEGVEEGETEEERIERAQAWWRVGQCHWSLRESESTATQTAYDAYIAALRAWPNYAPAFTALGIYYRSLASPDWDRSSKCFQKAFELDPGQEVSARFLAEEFAELSEWSLVEVIARRVIEGNKGRAGMGSKAAARLAWAWKAIGASELNSKRYAQAITAFQSALRGAPDDVSTWIKLGVAYRHSGKHVAALKVFGKALTHEPNSWFARYSIADVQRDIGLLEPAMSTFKALLQERPEELGVHVVLAETALTKGLAEQRKGFAARAVESLCEALRHAISIVKTGTATRVAWKVATDALAGLGKIANLKQEASELEESCRTVVTLLAEADIDRNLAGVTAVSVAFLQENVGQVELQDFTVALAVGTSKLRVLLESQNEMAVGSAWFDLAVAISNFRSRFARFALPPVTSDQALQQSIKCLKFALHKEPLNSTFWNALGVLAFDASPRLAQHCFIRSIEHNSRTAVPWTNLGLFYLVYGDEDLANQSFLRAQVLDPDWTAAWIGQATLADLAGHASEASVLLDHAFSLGGDSPEADIAYASRAYQRYRDSLPSSDAAGTIAGAATATEALSGPLFAASRYLTRYPDDYGALHLYALMLERVGDLDSAGHALQKAAELIEGIYEIDESPVVEGRYVIAQTNLGRVGLAGKNHAGALEAFEAALSLLDPSAPPTEGGLTAEESLWLFTQCRMGSSLAQIALGDMQTAVQTLEATLEDIESSANASCGDHLNTALARVHWKRNDEDRALAAFLDSPDVPQSRRAPLFLRRAFLAYAIATDDTALLQGGRSSIWDPAVKYDADIIQLVTLRHLNKGEADAVLSAASRALHAHPWTPTARTRVAQLVLSAIDLDAAASQPSEAFDALRVVDRLIREHVSHAEEAAVRTRRARSRGIVALAREPEEGDAEELRPSREAEAQGWLEKAVFTSPWDAESRKALQSISSRRTVE